MAWPPTPSEFADAVGALVRENFDRDHFLAPVAFVFASRDPDTGRRIEPTLLTFVLVGHPSSFASQLRDVARELDAFMLMQAYEVRMVGTLREQPARGFENLTNAPDAKDYVVMLLEERRSATPLAWRAPVREGLGALGPFEQAPVDRVEGWLTAVLALVS
jgi:hypothetical protein